MAKGILYVLLYAAFNVSGAALIKWKLRGKALSNISEWFGFLTDLSFIMAFLLIIVSALTLFKALSTSDFSFIIPIATGVNFMLTIGVGYYLFQDKVSLISLLGFTLIIGGIIVLSLNNHLHA